MDRAQRPVPPAVIIPVFNGHAAVARCLASLARHTSQEARVVLVDDASTDSRIAPLLGKFAQRRANVEILRNPVNLGFVGAVNRAFAATTGDVVVLNSDTVVTAGWLEGLVRCRDSDPAIGIACPLSNNATILSLPGIETLYPGADGEADVDAIGACVARVAERSYPRLPVAVGFCMLVTRDVLAACGMFDPVYGRGYGEECDLSMRALDRGFAIACCDDVYVHHSGAASFGSGEGVEGARARNAVVLDRRWPMYSPGVAAWGRANPLRRVRERVNAAAERERMPGRLRVLQVLHRLETRGGIEEHVRSIVNVLKGDVAFTLVLPGREGGPWTDFTEERPVAHLRVLRMNPDLATAGVEVIGHRAQVADPGVERAFQRFVEGGFDVVHFHSLVGWNTLRLPAIARATGARVLLTAHDYSLQCADYNMMLGHELQPCGRGAARATDAACVPCLRSKSRVVAPVNAPPSISAFVEARFAGAAAAVASADAIVCPSRFAADRIARGFGPAAAAITRVIGHGVPDYELLPRPRHRPALRVTYLGSFTSRKGAASIIEAARRTAGQGVEFEAWGPVEPGLGGAARDAGIALHGAYDGANLPEALRDAELVIVPSLMEESFCLVLSEAQRLGIPVVASERGAIPERVREGETGFLFPAGDADALVALLYRLRDDRAALDTVAARLREERPRTLADSALDYLVLYRALGSMPAHEAPSGPASDEPDAVRGAFGLPRERKRTPLGTDDFDAWVAAEAAAPVGRVAAGRIKVVMLPQEISERAIERTNEQVTQAGTEWVILLEPGDALAPGAVEAFLRGAEAHPEAILLYGSDDAMSLAGERYDPLPKPAFDPALLVHRPYIAGACAVHRERLQARGGLRATGWMGVLDLALNLAREGAREAVVAIPELLVHRLDSNVRALEAPAWLSAYRERAAAIVGRGTQAVEPPAIDVLVHCDGDPARAVACLEALLEATEVRLGVLLVDLDAARCTAVVGELARRGREAKVDPLGISGSALASALKRPGSAWLARIDARCGPFASAWLDRLDAAIAEPRVGAIAPDLAGPSGSGIPGWEIVGGGPWAIAGEAPPARRESRAAVLYQMPRAVSALSPRCVLLRREAVLRSGVVDELAHAGPFAITHIGLALQQAGFELRSDPAFAATWQAGESPEPARPLEAEWMRGRWGERLAHDAHFHPDLARSSASFGLAPRFPPRAAGDAARTRICAFPFDRWGSGTLRVRQPCAALERAGLAHVALMGEHDAGSVPNRLEWQRLDGDTLFAHNFLHEYQVLALEEYAGTSKALRVLGLDDLLTDIPPGNPYAATIYRDIGERIRRAVSLCDRLVVSTEPLADAFARSGVEVCVIANAIDMSRWSGLANQPRMGPRPRVGWAGARQHLMDLRLLEPVMRATCREVDWVFLGMCPPELRAMASEVHPMVPIGDYPARLASLGLDVAVAPLVDHPFNRAKSNLKALEYGVLGMPVIASDLLPYRGMPVTRIGSDPGEWVDALRHFVADRQRARDAGQELRDWVLANATLDARIPAWRHALCSARGAPPRTTT